MSTPAMLTTQSRTTLRNTAIATGAVLLAGLLIAPDRVWSNLLVGAFFLLTLALGGTTYLALTSVAGARWHVAFRRVPEAMAATLPIIGIAILIVLAPKMHHYAWHHHGESGAGTFWFKEVWLTPTFWLLRSIAYIVIWTLVGGWLIARSKKIGTQLADSAEETSGVRVGALFLVIYAITFSLASVDWIMALEPMWFSTMWGVYNFAGMILATLAAIVILGVLASEPGRALDEVFTREHLHDLGRLIVGFSCFWMYIWFSQYMLIWYSNLPEETSYFVARTHGAWGPIVVASIVLNWIVPFFVLLPRPSKRSRRVMVRVAVVLLIGRWLDLVLMVFPSTLGDSPRFGLWEIAAVICTISAGAYLVDRAFCTPFPAAADPRLQKGVNYHAG